jgi:hypothetical protein
VRGNEESVFPGAVFVPHLHLLPAAKNISGVGKTYSGMSKLLKVPPHLMSHKTEECYYYKFYSLYMFVKQEVQRLLTSQKFDIQMRKPKTEEVYIQHCV